MKELTNEEFNSILDRYPPIIRFYSHGILRGLIKVDDVPISSRDKVINLLTELGYFDDVEANDA